MVLGKGLIDPHGDMRATFLASLEYGVNPICNPNLPTPQERERTLEEARERTDPAR